MSDVEFRDCQNTNNNVKDFLAFFLLALRMPRTAIYGIWGRPPLGGGSSAFPSGSVENALAQPQ